MVSSPQQFTLSSLASSVGLVAGCFMFAILTEGTHPGEAAVAATAVAGTVGPGGSTSLAGELSSMAAAMKGLIRSTARRIA